MPKEFGRNSRVAQFVKEELAVLIQREFPLNQYGMITLTNVDVSPDLRNATVYITALNNNEPKDKLVAALSEQAGYFRHEIAKMMTSKGVPALCFKYDEAIERAQRLTDIINSVSHGDDETSE